VFNASYQWQILDYLAGPGQIVFVLFLEKKRVWEEEIKVKKIPQISQIRRRRKKRLRPGLCLLFGLILVLVGSTAVHLCSLHLEMNKQLSALNQEKDGLLQQQKLYEEEIERLNDPAYIEQLAREELGLVRHGEIIIAPKK
jgi:cell division protein DivIC